jgi:hypothetical protein
MHTIQNEPGENPAVKAGAYDDPPEPAARASISAEQRQQMIAAAAYHHYELRGGTSSDPLNDWLEAEKEVDAALAGGESRAGAKSAFLRMLSTVLAECQTQIDELGAKAKAASTAMRRKYEEQLAAVTPKYEAARGKLVEIREHTDDAWGHLREGAEKAANEMRIAVREAASLFK